MERMRTPYGRVAGLGSAKEGVQHWWMQRLTAVALIPLSLWFAISVAGVGGSYEAVHAWLRVPGPSILMILFLGSALYHAMLGVQVVLEDYVHCEKAKIASLVSLKLVTVLLAVAGIYAVLRVGFGG